METLSLFYIEYLFLKARSKSAGETIEVKITDPEDDTTDIPYKINIDKIGVKKTEGHSTTVKLTEDMSLIMRYPDISFFSEGIDISDVNSSMSVISRCVSQLVVGDEVYNRGDITDSEMDEWLESLSSEQFKKITEFFVTMPKLAHTIHLKNPNTGREFSMTLQGLADFF